CATTARARARNAQIKAGRRDVPRTACQASHKGRAETSRSTISTKGARAGSSAIANADEAKSRPRSMIESGVRLFLADLAELRRVAAFGHAWDRATTEHAYRQKDRHHHGEGDQ